MIGGRAKAQATVAKAPGSLLPFLVCGGPTHILTKRVPLGNVVCLKLLLKMLGGSGPQTETHLGETAMALKAERHLRIVQAPNGVEEWPCFLDPGVGVGSTEAGGTDGGSKELKTTVGNA